MDDSFEQPNPHGMDSFDHPEPFTGLIVVDEGSDIEMADDNRVATKNPNRDDDRRLFQVMKSSFR